MLTECPICGNPSPIAYAEKIEKEKLSSFSFSSRKPPEFFHYEYRLCKACDFLFSSVRPSEDSLHLAYEQAEYDSSAESVLAAESYVEQVQEYLELQPGSRVLDVGCGDAAFLNLMQERLAQVGFGIEPSVAPAREAANVIGDRLFVGPWLDYQSAERFALITLFQTIEHIEDPGQFLKFAASMLEAGGVVAIVAHDKNSVVNRILGTRSPIFDIEHLQIFSQRAMRRLLEKHGFVILNQKRFLNRYPPSYFLRLLGVESRKPPANSWLSRFLSKLIVPAPFGNQIVLAEKID